MKHLSIIVLIIGYGLMTNAHYNEPSQKIGRGALGGNPGGVVSAETFAWWKQMVADNPEAIIISVHH